MRQRKWQSATRQSARPGQTRRPQAGISRKLRCRQCQDRAFHAGTARAECVKRTQFARPGPGRAGRGRETRSTKLETNSRNQWPKRTRSDKRTQSLLARSLPLGIRGLRIRTTRVRQTKPIWTPGRLRLGIGDCRLGIRPLEAWNAEARNDKRTQSAPFFGWK